MPDPKPEAPPDQKGESAWRAPRYEKGGGTPLKEPLEDGDERGVDEEGRIDNGTHGGPKEKPPRVVP
jgi:hypothetical protein